MIEEIISEAKPRRIPKLLAAKQTLTDKLPAFDSKISFQPFINYLKKQLPVTTGIKTEFYQFLIQKFESRPALTDNAGIMLMPDENADLLELLSNSLFPAVGEDEKNSFALGVPYQFKVFYHSNSFKELFLDDEQELLLLPDSLPVEALRAMQASMIYDQALEKFYNIKLNGNPELIYSVPDPETGMKRYYKMRYDRRFIDIHAKGDLPSISDCPVCLNTFRILDLDRQLETMPLDLFEVEGFSIWVAEDVTISESLETIKRTLLRQDECDTGVINELKGAVQILTGLNDLEIGLMPLIKINGNYVLNQECIKHRLVSRQWMEPTEENMTAYRRYLSFIEQHPEPMPISSLNDSMLAIAPFMESLMREGKRSYIGYAMQNSDGLLGILELASTVPNQLTQDVLSKLEPAIPLLSVAMLKNRDNFNVKIEKLIKEKFTALQDSVQWKFAEVAWSQMQDSDQCFETANVTFENVYPLYGAIDIRNSSAERNLAIQKDLKEHLLLIDQLLDKLDILTQLPLIEGLKFRNDTIRQTIQDTLLAKDEILINEFLENEIMPVFAHLQKGNNPDVREIVDGYYCTVADCNSPLNNYRREYDESIAAINEAVLRYLEQQEKVLQQSYPHYFEKYRTDGVEYNIYIGQSIAPNQPFDVMYQKNMRLWQIKSMAEVARITHKLLHTLKTPLETTQLILIHNQPISICFRKDERKFDVEGSYNIRYEIMKKRLDKVRIKDSGERLTQPGKISMVYSNVKDVQEYQMYADFLQNKNILKPGIEHLELEELQGVKGLKAMRVDINLED